MVVSIQAVGVRPGSLMQNTNQNCAEHAASLLPSAEKELAAYAAAVQDLFGPHQARQSIEDWMEELEMTNGPTEAETPDWRSVTIVAAARLAARVNLHVSTRRPSSRISAAELDVMEALERRKRLWGETAQPS